MNTSKLQLPSWLIVSVALAVSMTSVAATGKSRKPQKNEKLATKIASKEVLKKVQMKKTGRWLLSISESDENLTQEKLKFLKKKRLHLIQSLEGVLRNAKNPQERVDLNMRLGRLYIEDYYSNIESYYLENKSSNALTPFTRDLSLDKARALYKYLATHYQNDPRRDEMLYFFAVTSLDKDIKSMTQNGMAALDELTAKYPKSKFAVDSLVQLGDYYFDQAAYSKAETYYDKIIKSKNLRLISYAAYKKAWCSYNQSDPEKAIYYFKWIIENEKKNKMSLALRVRAESLRDIAFPFVELKAVNRSISFFKAFDKTIYRAAIETMADLYKGAGDYDNAIILYDNLIDSDETFIGNPSYEVKVVDALLLQSKPEDALSRLYSNLIKYQPNSTWEKANSSKPSEVEREREGLEKSARLNAIALHETAAKTNSRDLYAQAEQWYLKYLEYFNGAYQSSHATQEASSEIRLRLADLQFKNERYESSANHYARAYNDSKVESTRQTALLHALMALDKQLGTDFKVASTEENRRELTQFSKGTIEQRQNYSPAEAKFITLAREYISKFPNAKENPDVIYGLGSLQYRHSDSDAAFNDLNKLVTSYPNHASSINAGELMLDLLNRKEDYKGLIDLCERLQNKGPQNTEFQKKVAQIYRRSVLKTVESQEQAGNLLAAANGYAEYAKKFGPLDETLYEKALYNGAVTYVKINSPLKATELLDKLLRIFPKSNLKANALILMAHAYESVTDFGRAAQVFNSFQENFPAHSEAKNALRIAGIYFRGVGAVEKAEEAFKKYIKRYPLEVESIEPELVALYEASGNTLKISNLHRKAIDERKLSPLYFVLHSVALAESLAKLKGPERPQLPTKMMENTLAYARQNERALRKSIEGTESLAKLLYWSLEAKKKQFYQINLHIAKSEDLNKGLQVAMQKKLDLLKTLEEGYAEISSFGNEDWGLGGMYETASLYYHLSQEAKNAPLPKDLSAKGLESYTAEIKNQIVDPFSQKALNLINRCVGDASELHLLSPWIARCYALGSQIDLQNYPNMRSLYLAAIQGAQSLPPNKESMNMSSLFHGASMPLSYGGLFSNSVTRRALSSIPTSALYVQSPEIQDVSGTYNSIPTLMDYRLIASQRSEELNKALSKVSKNAPYDMNSLNILRLSHSADAVSSIKDAIQKDPANMTLQNLLGLTYIEFGDLESAETVWLSMSLRGILDPSLLNNLGVISLLKGKEMEAVSYFKKAIQLDSPPIEAFSNLGFMALKYRNASEAKSLFDKVLISDPSNVMADIGVLNSLIQSKAFEEAKDKASQLISKYPDDPYARLTAAYVAFDISKDRATSEKWLTEYIKDKEATDALFPFQKVLKEVRFTKGDLLSVSEE